MLLHGIDCERQPLDNRPAEETEQCELLGGCAPPCTEARPCPRQVCIPQGVSTESSQVLELFSAARTAETTYQGAGLAIIDLEMSALPMEERSRMWRLLICLMRWLGQHRKEINAEQELNAARRE